jgi:hypothetical protein
MRVCDIILQQLGGNKFIASTGAKELIGDNKVLQFGIGRGAKSGINKVRITLTPTDTYDIEFGKYSRPGINKSGEFVGGYTTIKHIEGIYADVLQEVFERHTGFRCKALG